MCKFKIGDWVVRSSEFRDSLGEYFREENPLPFEVKEFSEFASIVDPKGKYHSSEFLSFSTIEEVPQGLYNRIESPIKKIPARMQPVRGSYGNWLLEIPNNEIENIKIKSEKHSFLAKPTIKELRDMAFFATELADFMEENKDAYKYN